jgi:SulP family sulfate permease
MFFAAVALAGVIQIIVGLFKLGKFIRLVPQPVMFGFVNGLGSSYILISAPDQFKTIVNGESVVIRKSIIYMMIGLVLTIAIVLLFPKVSKNQFQLP